jgi:hypothetical protein
MSTDVIKEFLVSLGFKINEQGYKKFKDGVSGSSLDMQKLGLAAVGTAASVGYAVAKISKEYETLYWASQRTGATVANLQAVSYAASQIGLSAEQGKGAIEGMTAAMRMNPGLQGLAMAYGANAKDPTERLLQIVKNMKEAFGPNGYFAAAQQAAMFSIPEPVFFQMWENGDRMKAEAEDYRKRLQDAGVDAEKLAKSSNELQTELRRLSSDLGIMGDKIFGGLVVPIQTTVEWTDKLVQHLDKLKLPDWMAPFAGIGAAVEGAIQLSDDYGLSGSKAVNWAKSSAPVNKVSGGVSSLSNWLGLSADDWMGVPAPGGVSGQLLPQGSSTPKTEAGPITPTSDIEKLGIPKDSSHVPTDPRSRREFVADFFMKHGWTREQAWGWAGNFAGETNNFNPAEGGQNGEDSYGVGQWHPERRADFKGWSGHDMRGTGLFEQLEFANYEVTEGKYKAAGDALRRAKTAREATAILVSQYERPRDVHGNIRSRGDVADQWFRSDQRLGAVSAGGVPQWGASIEPASSTNSISQSNNLSININGVTDPEGLRGAMVGAADELNRHLMIRLDSIR